MQYFAVMSILFIIGLGICFLSGSKDNPIITNTGINQLMSSTEGKEMRFGVEHSSLFTTVTTSFRTSTVNNIHDTLTPLGGMIAILNMMLNVVFGGKGVGVVNMILYATFTFFPD